MGREPAQQRLRGLQPLGTRGSAGVSSVAPRQPPGGLAPGGSLRPLPLQSIPPSRLQGERGRVWAGDVPGRRTRPLALDGSSGGRRPAAHCRGLTRRRSGPCSGRAGHREAGGRMRCPRLPPSRCCADQAPTHGSTGTALLPPTLCGSGVGLSLAACSVPTAATMTAAQGEHRPLPATASLTCRAGTPGLHWAFLAPGPS